MKISKYLIAFAMLISIPFAVSADDVKLPSAPIHIQGGPGIVTSISVDQNQLPKEAQQFLQRIYSRDAVGPIKHNIIKDQYKVELGNGTKITFDKEGKVVDINAPQGESLYGRAVEAILPAKTFEHLEQAGLLESVTGITDFPGHGTRVRLLNAMPPEILFDVDGVFVIMDY